MRSQIVVHYGEVGTKGGNRTSFESCLGRNLRASLHSLEGLQIRKLNQRFFVYVDQNHLGEAKTRIANTFGVAWYATVEDAPLSYPELLQRATELLKRQSRSTFRVTARRQNKSFPMTSQEVARKLGEDLISALGLKVNLTSPDIELFVDVISDRFLLYFERLRGLGGLPVGVTGRVLHLLSGGIDSPASAWLMMKRGCKPVYLHFYIAPTSQPIVESKIADLIRKLSTYGGGNRLILIPFAPYQLATVGLPQEFEPTVFRYFMRIVAEKLADEMEFPAISTGDNLGQVASQTLYNISCIDRNCSVPTLRPLLGYDKEEIVQLAKRIGTYETSLQDYKDCCSIVSRHPKTRMKWVDVEAASRAFGFDKLADECISMGSSVSYEDKAPKIDPLESVLGRHHAAEATV